MNGRKHLSAFEKQELIRLCPTMTNVELAIYFDVCYDTIIRIFTRLRAAGIEVPPRKRGRRSDREYQNYPKIPKKDPEFIR